jgi:hypothetical protein
MDDSIADCFREAVVAVEEQWRAYRARAVEREARAEQLRAELRKLSRTPADDRELAGVLEREILIRRVYNLVKYPSPGKMVVVYDPDDVMTNEYHADPAFERLFDMLMSRVTVAVRRVHTLGVGPGRTDMSWAGGPLWCMDGSVFVPEHLVDGDELLVAPVDCEVIQEKCGVVTGYMYTHVAIIVYSPPKHV